LVTLQARAIRVQVPWQRHRVQEGVSRGQGGEA